MQVLLYVNPDKDPQKKHSELLISLLNKYGIDYSFLPENCERTENSYDAIIAIGGDGTILRRTTVANLSGIPIIGINAGKLGFLTEFELSEAENAVNLLKNGKLVKDERATLKISYNGNTFYALNDCVLLREYEENKGMTIKVGIKLDGMVLRDTIGDGVIISTATGSTGYSFSAGGSIIAPNMDAFCITPVATHSFLSRSLVYSSEKKCELELLSESMAGLYVDGKLIAKLEKGEKVNICCAENKTSFYRKTDFNFFDILNKKLQDR